jgi:hypothetical protein
MAQHQTAQQQPNIGQSSDSHLYTFNRISGETDVMKRKELL